MPPFTGVGHVGPAAAAVVVATVVAVFTFSHSHAFQHVLPSMVSLRDHRTNGRSSSAQSSSQTACPSFACGGHGTGSTAGAAHSHAFLHVLSPRSSFLVNFFTSWPVVPQSATQPALPPVARWGQDNLMATVVVVVAATVVVVVVGTGHTNPHSAP